MESAFAADTSRIRFEATILTNGGPKVQIQRAWIPGSLKRHPVVLVMGSIKPPELPSWSTNLIREGYMLAVFTVAHEPDPDPARRPQWLVFDERFAHSYVVGGQRTPVDARRVIDHLVSLPEVDSGKIGWMGSSTTGIFGLAAAVHEPRIKALVAFVATGAYDLWLKTWKPNGLWSGGTNGLWPETVSLLPSVDPIHSVSNLFPAAILLVNGSGDKVVDPSSTHAFVSAATPFYTSDPERLRFVIYEGHSHNLPIDVVQMYCEHWFRLYLNPETPPPSPKAAIPSLAESTKRTALTAETHDKIVQAGTRTNGSVKMEPSKSPVKNSAGAPR